MKKLISLALVLVMAMVCLTACGVELQTPEGAYSSDSGTYKAEFSGYDAKENVGNITITRTIMDTPTVVTGKYSVAVNDPDAGTFFIDITLDGSDTPVESFMGYDPAQKAVIQLMDIADIGGANITYYPVEAEEE